MLSIFFSCVSHFISPFAPTHVFWENPQMHTLNHIKLLGCDTDLDFKHWFTHFSLESVSNWEEDRQNLYLKYLDFMFFTLPDILGEARQIFINFTLLFSSTPFWELGNFYRMWENACSSKHILIITSFIDWWRIV